MKSEYLRENQTLTIKFEEEIDQNMVDIIRRKIDNKIENYIPQNVIFDFENIDFMDSSGIGMVIGRYKLIKMIGGNLKIINAKKNILRIFEMSGVTRIILVEPEKRLTESKN